MNYDIRKICDYFREVHSRYCIDSNGVVYTSLGEDTTKIMVDWNVINIKRFRLDNIEALNNTNKLLMAIPNTNNRYYLKSDGTILHRLSTRIDEIGVTDVNLLRVDGNERGNRYKVHRLLAGCFLGDVNGMEVHHINGNRLDNRLSNLKILTFEEHRGKGNYTINHEIGV